MTINCICIVSVSVIVNMPAMTTVAVLALAPWVITSMFCQTAQGAKARRS